MPEPILTTAALIAGAKTASELLDSFSKVCSSVKQAAQSGRELKDAGTIIGSLFAAEDRCDELEKQAKSKGNLQEAISLVAARGQIREDKRFIRSFLSWACPTGMYQDWIAIEKLRGEFQEDLDNELPTTKENMAKAKKARSDDSLMDMIKVMIALIAVIIGVIIGFGQKIKESLSG